MDIEAFIASAETHSATTEAAPVAETKPEAEATNEAPQTTAETEGNEPQAAPEDKSKDDAAFPKKALNAISYRDKKIGKLEAKYQQAIQERDALLKQVNPEKPEAKDAAPKEEDYVGKPYGDYLKAEARYAARQELNETQVKQAEQQVKSVEEEWEAERAKVIDENYQEAVKALPNYPDLIKQNVGADGKIPLTPDARRALQEADNGAFALYSILQEGLLSELNNLPLARAAMLVARMEDKGIALTKTKPVSNAPAPMSPSKGNAASGKADDDLIKEVLAYVKK